MQLKSGGIYLEKEINEQKQIAYQIKLLRISGNLEKAIDICEQATQQYPDENFFFKILGDLQYECSMYEESFYSYIQFVLCIGEKTNLITNLFRFINKLRTNESFQRRDEFLCNHLIEILDNDAITVESRVKLVEFISDTFTFSDARVKDYLSILCDPRKGSVIKQFINKETQGTIYDFFFVIGQQLKLSEFKICENNYKIVASSMEKNKFLNIALKLTLKMLKTTQDGVVVRTLFRLCRQLGDYSAADRYLEDNPYIIDRGDFNIQYELVYYFKEKRDNEQLLQSLSKIRVSARRSPAISKTLYNFYVQFEMLTEADEMITHMERLNQEKIRKKRQLRKGEDTATETDEGVWAMLRDIVSEKEHNRQLIATKDLIKGFSHELGQPLTNIRYDIGLYFMKKKYGKALPTDFDDILNNILRQISRIDKLMKRFSPIFSSKSENINFNIKEEIQNVFDELSMRLESDHIRYLIEGHSSAILFGDPLKFHQIFYNLIINAIHSVRESGADGELTCLVEKKPNKIIIKFSDNGKGIPDSLANKIFEPFFSTKQEKVSPTKDDGGEGLGLYIVWNIVKMFNGTIHVNKNYQNGAQFILEFMTDNRREVNYV